MRTFGVSKLTKETLSESVTVQGGAVDPTTRPASIAVVSAGRDPVDGDWLPASWYTDDDGKAWAQIGLGTTVPLADGIFDAWLRVDLISGVEVPVRRFARFYVY